MPTTISRTYEQARFGSYSLRLTTTDPNGYAIFGVPGTACTVGAGVSCSFSAWIYCTAAIVGNVLTMGWNNYNGAAYIDSVSANTVITQTGWNRFVYNGVTSALTTNALPWILLTNAGVIWIDACQFETLAYVTPYGDGSLPGHAWTGAVHASTSNRTAIILNYADPIVNGLINPTRGTVMGWVYVDQATGAIRHLLRINGGAGWITLQITDANNIQGYWGVAVVTGAGAPLATGAWHHLAMTYEAGVLRLYVDGILSTSGTSVGFTDGGNALEIGRNPAASEYLNGYAIDVVILDRVLTAREIAGVYGAGHALGYYGA